MSKTENHGKNYPPIHPNDRCTTVAEFDDDVIEGLQRRGRDENGNSILVPQNTTYTEWNKKYKPNLTLQQGSISNKKEKMNWQEQNEKMKSTKIKPILYSSKIKSYRIEKYQDKIMKLYQNNKNENMCILNSITGELIGNITEGKNRNTVGLDTKTMLKMLSKGKNSIIIIHNHPENYSFSFTDIKAFNKFKQIDSMILLTDNYKFYLRNNSIKLDHKTIEQTYAKIEKQIKKRYNMLNSIERRDLTNQEFFKKVGWIYEKEKN